MLNTVLTVRAHQANSHRGIGMGGVHGRRDHSAQQSGPPYRVYPLGSSGAAEKGDAEQSEAPDPDGAPSQSAVRLPRILRQQALQSDK